MTDIPVWHGIVELSDSLVRIDSLEPTAGNPRRGRLDRISASLERFGQRRYVIVDGNRIIAGHHLTKAAEGLGWTHVAVQSQNFTDEHEANAFALADNRSHDGGSYDDSALAAQLEALADLDKLHGTGYGLDDLDDLQDKLRRQHESAARPAGEKDKTPPTSDLVEEVLVLTRDQHDQLKIWLRIVETELRTNGLTETVYAGLEVAAQQLNS